MHEEFCWFHFFKYEHHDSSLGRLADIYWNGQWPDIPNDIAAPVCSRYSERWNTSHVTHIMQLPHLPSVSETRFINHLSFTFQILWKFCRFNSVPNNQITTNFCTFHHSTAVVPCANIFSNHFCWNLVVSNNDIFIKFELWWKYL